MAHKIADWVNQTSTSIGALTIEPSGAVFAPNRAFSDVLSDGDTTQLMVVDRRSGAWQAAVYSYAGGILTLDPEHFFASSTGSPITFGAGVKDVSITPLAEQGRPLHRTADFTALPLPYDVDTTAGPVTALLTASPAEGERFPFSDFAGTWGTNAFTIDPNGNEFEDTGDSSDPAAPKVFDDPAWFCIVFAAGKYRIRGREIQTGARPGEYQSPFVGNAVFDSDDGSWTVPGGGDHTAAMRQVLLTARTFGLRPYFLPGAYLYTGGLFLTGEAYDNGGVRGEPGRTVFIQKSSGQPNSFQGLVFDGTLQVDGITTTPVYYLIEPARKGASAIRLNTSDALEDGMPIMLVDMVNGINVYSTSTAGTKVANKGQVVTITARDLSPAQAYTLTSQPIAYDPDSNLFTLRTTVPIDFGSGEIIHLSGLGGTGDFALLEGDQVTVDPTTGSKVTFVIDDIEIDASTTITSGTLTWGTATPGLIAIEPPLEFDYAGDPSDPKTTSTCIRRFTSSPKDVVVEGIVFDYDRTDPAYHTQARLLMRSLTRPKVIDCEFWGPSIGVAWDLGTHGFEERGCYFAELGPQSICNTFASGVYDGFIEGCFGTSARHFTNTTSNLSSSAPGRITTQNCHMTGFWFSPYTDHPGVWGMRWIGCEAIGGKTVQTSAFQLRGDTEEVVDCFGSGFQYGVSLIFCARGKVTGGEFINNQVGIRVSRCLDTIIDGPVIRGSVFAHILFDLVQNTNPYTTTYPGFKIRATTVDGVPSLGDVVYALRNGNFAPAWDPTWRLDGIEVDGRTLKYIVVSGSLPQSMVPSNYAFLGRYSHGMETIRALVGVPLTVNLTPWLDCVYTLDTTNSTISAVLPAPELVRGQELQIIVKKPGANAATITGTIDGTTNPTPANGVKMKIKSDARTFTAASGTYTTVSGTTVLTMTEALPIGVGESITVSGLTGTGSVSSINGTYTTITNTTGKTVRFTAPTGLGTIAITGGFVTIGGWKEIT